MSLFAPAEQQSLLSVVVEAFSADDLAQLSRYRLGQRLEVLVSTNRGLAAVVSDLIDLVEKLGWTEEFVRGVYEERKENPTVRQFCEVHARFVFEPRQSAQDLTRDVGIGLAAVVTRLGEPNSQVRTILLGQATQNLSDLGTQFTRLRRYKVLHDCLHNLQFKYARLIATEIRVLREDDSAADNLATYFREMADELAQTRPEIEGLESRAAEQMWLNVADESVLRMQAGAASRSPVDTTKGFQLLDGLLRVQPTRINELLTTVLERLQLDRLRSTLSQLAEPLGSDARPLVQAAIALGNLTPRLNRMLADHKEWQLVDISLHQIDLDLKLGSSLEQCAFLWAEVGKILGPLLDRDRGAAWSEELRQLGSDLSNTFVCADQLRVQTVFKRLLPRTTWFFYQADKSLKELSGELDQVGGKLRDILQEIGNA